MDSGNLYPNNGANHISHPIEQQLEKAKEDAQVAKAMPLIRDIVERFEERVKFYNSLDSIPQDILTIPDEFMHLVAAHKLTGQQLAAELDYLKDLIEQHNK